MSDKKHFTQEDVGDEEIKWTGNPKIESEVPSIIVGLLLLPFIGIGVLFLIGVYTKINYTTYAITDKALYKKKGMLSDKTKRVPLSKIQNTEYSRSFIEKQFGYGTVEISSAGSSGKELSFSAVTDPKKTQELINELSNKNENSRQNNQDITDNELKEEIIKTRENLEEIANYLEENQ